MPIISLDLSLSDTGIAVFDEKTDKNAQLLKVFSIRTDAKEKNQLRLKRIADAFLKIREEYDFSLVLIEKGFFRFTLSTQAIYMVHGVAQYIFSDINQIYIPPTTVKKIVGGKGNADKKVLSKIVREKYPDFNFKNDDETDAVAIGLSYFYGEEK